MMINAKREMFSWDTNTSLFPSFFFCDLLGPVIYFDNIVYFMDFESITMPI